jgi:hypothetical protein
MGDDQIETAHMAAISVAEGAFLFPVNSLLFAAAWVNRAPGWLGWGVSCELVPEDETSFREQVSVTGPVAAVLAVVMSVISGTGDAQRLLTHSAYFRKKKSTNPPAAPCTPCAIIAGSRLLRQFTNAPKRHP